MNLCAFFRRKNGSEIVEASIVLPLFFLTVFSMILLMSYCFLCLEKQTDMHEKLTEEAIQPASLFQIEEQDETVHKELQGIISGGMKKEIHGHIYCFSQADLNRMGRMISS